MDVLVLHTAQLSEAQRRETRALLDLCFDDMTDEDWQHALGGLHALAYDSGELIGHAAVVQRVLIHHDRPLRCGYVEAVATHPSHRRLSVGNVLMAELERIIERAYDIGALGASDEGALFYTARGWQRWRGRSFALTPSGVVRTPAEDDGLFVWPVTVPLDLDGDLVCDWRAGDVW